MFVIAAILVIGAFILGWVCGMRHTIETWHTEDRYWFGVIGPAELFVGGCFVAVVALCGFLTWAGP